MAESKKRSVKSDNNDVGLTDLLSQQPPHNVDIEKALLATLMSIDESFDKISDIVTKDDFYAGRHQHIFAAIAHLALVGLE